MQLLEILVWWLGRAVFLIKTILKFIGLILLLIFIFKIKIFITYIDAKNPSFYIAKYNLMPIVSGIISGLITLIAMLYIEHRGKKQAFWNNLATKKFETLEKYEKLLESLNTTFETIQYVKLGMATFNKIEDFEEFIKYIRDKSRETFSLVEEMWKYSAWYSWDSYINRFYRYKYLARGAEKLLDMYKNKDSDLDLKITKGEDYVVVKCPKIDDIIVYRWWESVKSIEKDIKKEILQLGKKYLYI